MKKLLDESKHKNDRSIRAKDAIDGYGINLTLFGEDDAVTTTRLLATKRWAMYEEFVIGEFRIGPQWREEQDWDTEFRTDFGVIFNF